jgi:hypothetical protein
MEPLGNIFDIQGFTFLAPALARRAATPARDIAILAFSESVARPFGLLVVAEPPLRPRETAAGFFRFAMIR